METPPAARLKSATELLQLGSQRWRERVKIFLVLSLIAGVLAVIGNISILLAILAFAGVVILYVGLFIIAINSPLSWKQLWPLVRSKFWAVIGVSILNWLVLLGGYTLLVIPGIILNIYLAFSLYAVLVDNERGLEALRKSRALTQGRWWSITWRVFVTGFVTGLIGAMLSVLTQSDNVVSVFLEAFFSLLLIGWGSCISFTLYQDLKATQAAANATAPAGFLTNYKALIGIGVVGLILIPILFFGLIAAIVASLI